MRVSQTGRGNLPQILHATGRAPVRSPCPFRQICSMHFDESGTHEYRLSQPRALGWEVLSALMSRNDYDPKVVEEICLKFCTQPALAPVHSPCLFQQILFHAV